MPTTSLLVSGDEFRVNTKAPICLSLDKSTLGGWLNSFLNIASHYEANSRVAMGAILNFSNQKPLILSLLLNS